jgi:hypothetical protein
VVFFVVIVVVDEDNDYDKENDNGNENYFRLEAGISRTPKPAESTPPPPSRLQHIH